MSIPLRVENICRGGLVERIHEEILRAIANIVDPNTDPKKARKVKVEISIRPNEQRNMAEIAVNVSSTLQAPRPIETGIMIGYNPLTGEVGASELASGEFEDQLSFPGTHEAGKIAKINQ